MNKPAPRRHPDFAELADLLCTIAGEDDAGPAAQIYQWYVNPIATASIGKGPLRCDEVDLVATLRAAHAASDVFDGGWRAQSVSTQARVLAERDGRTRLLDRVDYVVPHRLGLAAEPGDALMVTKRLDWLDEPTGFWHVQGGEWPPAGSDRLIRIYVNVEPRVVGRVLAALSEVLESDCEHPYVLKVQTYSVAMSRADTMVIYLSPAGFARHEVPLRGVVSGLGDLLRDATPRLTQLVSRGVAIAEGAMDGRSYGDEVAELATRALHRARATNRDHVAAMIAAIDATWADAGYDVEQPWLRPSRATNAG